MGREEGDEVARMVLRVVQEAVLQVKRARENYQEFEPTGLGHLNEDVARFVYKRSA